jgi:outer membrane protein OmpA-like peptidoglycan-associated protein
MQNRKNTYTWFMVCAAMVLALSPCSVFGAGAGTSGNSFLKIGVGARPEAMGEAYLALSDDSTGYFWNPAGLAQVTLPEISIMHLSYFADINYETLGLVMPIFGQNIGMGLTWLNVASFNSTLDPQAEQGSASDFSVTGAYAFNLSPQLMLGGNLKVVSSSLAGASSMGGAVDLGLLFKPFGREFAFALVAQNLGLATGYEETSDPLPISLRFGAAWRLYRHNIDNFANIILDVNKSIDDRFQYNLGGEGWLYDTVALRAGYKFSEGGSDLVTYDLNSLANFTAGLGLKLGAANIDYAFVPLGELGSTHRVSASWKFGFYPTHVEKEKMLPMSPKVSKLGDGVSSGVAFNIDNKVLNGVEVREWRIEIRDSTGRLVKSLEGAGDIPKNLAWDMTDYRGHRVSLDRPYKYSVLLRDKNGSAVSTEGFIAQEIKPREMMSSSPKFDSAAGTLVFQPKSSLNVGVKEWKLNIRNSSGVIIKTLSGTGAIPKNLAWKPSELAAAGGTNLAASKAVQSISYDLEFKDASGQSKVMSEKLRFSTESNPANSYHMPLPVKEFKVNRGREILVASLPSLTSANMHEASSAPFVMPAPEGGVRNWKLEVVDPKGNVAKTFKGSSEIPETIFWDGLNEQGLPVDNAEKSTFSFWVVNEAGKEIKTQVRRTVRNPFSISGAQGKVRKISGLWFRFLDADVQEAIVAKLRDIAQTIRKNPNVQVTIQGHSWDEGAPEVTLRLSQERADSVLRFLIEDEGISPRNVSSIGYGDTMPLVQGKDEASAARNRRVEIVIISK